MPSNRPFLDSGGFRGARFVKTVSRTIARSSIRFELLNNTHIRLLIPDRKPLKVNNNDALRLAHWILDNCTPLPKKANDKAKMAR